MIPQKIKKILVEISRIILGVVFIFSGFVKCVDPLGSAYKFEDYFKAFGLGSLDFTALPLSFVQGAFEFALGVLILFAVYKRVHATLMLLFMLFMTPLTLYLAIKNPVTDCGCFGDALVITNWETFYKNIVLLAAAIAVFCWNKYMTPVFHKKSFWLVTLYTYLFVFGLSIYCYQHLPILDFRPYKIGKNIPKGMHVPEGMPQDVFESILIYEKDGVKKEFTLENYPANDTTWKFVDSQHKLIKKGFQPPIHDFSITNTDGVEITDIILSDTSYTFLLIARKLELASDSNVDLINEIYDFSKQNGYGFYCLTASLPDEIQKWADNTGAEYPTCTTDEITLKTIIRSNPGLLLLKHGNIVNKWSHRDLPAGEVLRKPLNESSLGQTPPNKDSQKILISAAIFILPLLFIFLIGISRNRKKAENTNTTT